MKTGFKDLDAITELKEGELVVVGARPAMGKTSFVLNIMTHIALEEKKDVVYYSFEESLSGIDHRLISSIGNVEISKVKEYHKHYDDSEYLREHFTEEDIDRIKYGKRLAEDSRMHWFESGLSDIDELYNEFKYKDTKVIILDYLQLLRINGELYNNNNSKEIINKLKRMAVELNVLVIVTSQVSRKIDEREKKIPLISDFESAKESVMNNADKVIFIYKDSYYNTNSNNIADIIVSFNKNGNVGVAHLAWIPEFVMFGNTIIID